MTKFFKVAEHVFSVTMPDTCPLWEEMQQYDPFVIPEGDGAIFSVEVVDSLPERDRVKLYGGSEEPGEPVVMLYRAGEDWITETAVFSGRPFAARMLANADFTLGRVQILNPGEALFGLNNALMLMYAFRTAGMGTLEMHASVIVNGGRAFLWLAKSGTGKSTHSRLWLRYIEGSRLLNDDNPVVRLLPDGHVEVYGTPWSGKTPCYRNEHYPLGAFVQIRRSLVNSISPQPPLEAYATLYSSSSGFKSDPVMADQLHSTFEKMVSRCRFYNLDCRPDEEAARVSSKELLAL